MAPEDRPFLSVNRDDELINEQEGSEETPLLKGRKRGGRILNSHFWREVAVFLWALVATAAVLVLAVLYQHQRSSPSRSPDSFYGAKPHGKRNLIFMVSDGMGPASLSLTRSFRQHVTGLPIDDLLVLDRHLVGQSRTRSSSSLVTDSAAGATAFSCGMKSYNGAISMLPNHKPCGTVLEAAKRAGYTTGLVVTTLITDATPACFGSHVSFRNEQDSIARQLIGEHPLGHVVDLMFGGGRCRFLPKGTNGSCRADGTNVIETAQNKGYQYLKTRQQFDELEGGKSAQLPMLGLFAPGDIPYEIDRRNMTDVYPSLDEMAQVALEILKEATKDTEKGFFLMIEGSRIDHAGHGNDPAAQVHEVLAYDKAFNSVLDFLAEDETEGVLVSTSDHETGGLALSRQLQKTYPDYLWLPEVLARASHSSEYLARELANFNPSSDYDERNLDAFIRKQLREGFGITNETNEEVALLKSVASKSSESAYVFADIISRRAQLGWSTHGHSAVDVNIYSSNPNITELVGNHENTEVGHYLANFLDVDVDAITKELQQDKSGFFDKGASSDRQGSAGDAHMAANSRPEDLDHYESGFELRGAFDDRFNVE